MNTTPTPWKKRSVFTLPGGFFVVNYEFGHYVYPDEKAIAAMKKIKAAYDSLAAERAAINEWSGNLVLYGMNTRQFNPDIGGLEQKACFDDAKIAFPNAVYVDSWKSGNNGIHGLSVRLKGSQT